MDEDWDLSLPPEEPEPASKRHKAGEAAKAKGSAVAHRAGKTQKAVCFAFSKDRGQVHNTCRSSSKDVAR